jgi:hypothetical protein
MNEEVFQQRSLGTVIPEVQETSEVSPVDDGVNVLNQSAQLDQIVGRVSSDHLKEPGLSHTVRRQLFPEGLRSVRVRTERKKEHNALGPERRADAREKPVEGRAQSKFFGRPQALAQL